MGRGAAGAGSCVMRGRMACWWWWSGGGGRGWWSRGHLACSRDGRVWLVRKILSLLCWCFGWRFGGGCGTETMCDQFLAWKIRQSITFSPHPIVPPRPQFANLVSFMAHDLLFLAIVSQSDVSSRGVPIKLVEMPWT